MESRQEAYLNQYKAEQKCEKPCYKCKCRIEYEDYSGNEMIACRKEYCEFEEDET